GRWFRQSSSARQSSQVSTEQELGQFLRRLAELLEVLDRRPAALGIAGTQRRRDERLEQPRLAVGPGAERAEVAGRDPVALQARARRRDVGVALAVPALAALDARLEQPVLLERPRLLAGDTGPLAERVEVELPLRDREPGRAAPLALRAGPGREPL